VWLPTIEHMVMFVVKYIHIQINAQIYGSINYDHTVACKRIWFQYFDNG